MRSSVTISIVLLKCSFLALSIAHSARTQRSALFGSLMEFMTFAQSFLWIDTPKPRVTKPMISSPGSGLQQRANLTRQLSSPSTITPLEAPFTRCGLIGTRSVGSSGSTVRYILT